MKPTILFGLALCSLFLLESCKVKVTYVVPPSQDHPEVNTYAGKTIEWAPTGQPFQIIWGTGGSPCDPKDNLQSDGTSTVICHLPAGKYGDYEYYVAPPSNQNNATPNQGTGPFPAHVGKCSGCPQSDEVKGTTTAANAADKTQQHTQQGLSNPPTLLPNLVVKLSCDQSSGVAKADPTPLQAQIGQKVFWKYYGPYPQSGDIFDIQIPANVCSNHTNGTTINSDSDYCAMAASSPYTIKANTCSGNGTINVLAITTLQPSSAIAGSAGFTLTVNGTGFINGSGVNFNGNAKATTYVSPTQLTATILAGDVANAGTFPITVTNPSPSGVVTSNSVTFNVTQH